jgi:hypothetical protein
MTEQIANFSQDRKVMELFCREWMVLLTIGIFTVALIAGVTEFIARLMYPALNSSKIVAEICLFHDPATGMERGRQNCRYVEKLPETVRTEYRFNDCGYRTDLPCGPKPAGTFRIVMLGTSSTMGSRVPVEETLAVLLSKKLSQLTGREVQIYNEAIPFRFPDDNASHFDEVLKAQPDMILWALNPNEIRRQGDVLEPPSLDDTGLSISTKILRHLKAALSKGSISQALAYLFKYTRTYTLLCEFIYASPNQYVKIALMDPDPLMGFLRSNPREPLKIAEL